MGQQQQPYPYLGTAIHLAPFAQGASKEHSVPSYHFVPLHLPDIHVSLSTILLICLEIDYSGYVGSPLGPNSSFGSARCVSATTTDVKGHKRGYWLCHCATAAI